MNTCWRNPLVLLVLLLNACHSNPAAVTGSDPGESRGAGGGASNFIIDQSCQMIVNGVDLSAALAAAIPEGVRMAKSGVTYFDNAAKIGPVPYEHWFGPGDQIVPQSSEYDAFPERPKVEANVRKLARSITQWKFQFICRPTEFTYGDAKCVDSYAIVEHDNQDPHHVDICPLFFTLISKGANSQASTVAHEVGHFGWNNNEAGAGLTDEIMIEGFADLDAFAVYSSANPSLAWHDAYTYQLFLGSDPGNN